jgi:magnesium-transporting ATPase (P-type)
MGGGTDIAKCASDIVILDNSFSAIEKAVLYGRTIFKSIRKFITFQLTMNLSACGISLLGQFIGIDTPITIMQMLWVNIIMDTLGGLAYAGEAPLSYYMREAPKRRDEPILTSAMLRSICFMGVISLMLSMLFLTSPRVRGIYGAGGMTDELYTGFYCLFIFLGISNSFLARCERLWIFSDIGKNRPFVLIMLLISAIQITMIYFGGELFRCTPLTAGELIFAITLAFAVIPIEFMRRLLSRLG